jgi:hypothetical protein
MQVLNPTWGMDICVSWLLVKIPQLCASMIKYWLTHFIQFVYTVTTGNRHFQKRNRRIQKYLSSNSKGIYSHVCLYCYATEPPFSEESWNSKRTLSHVMSVLLRSGTAIFRRGIVEFKKHLFAHMSDLLRLATAIFRRRIVELRKHLFARLSILLRTGTAIFRRGKVEFKKHLFARMSSLYC